MLNDAFPKVLLITMNKSPEDKDKFGDKEKVEASEEHGGLSETECQHRQINDSQIHKC